MTHRTGHAHVLNSLALKELGIMSSTPDPPGGVIDRDAETGEPTGLLFEMGGYLRQRIPPLEPQMLMQGIKLANEKLLSMGITSIQDATHYNGSDQWHRFHEWKESGLLVPRVSMLVGSCVFESNANMDKWKSPDDEELSVGGVKIILDETTGRLSPSQPKLNKLVFDIHAAGRQAVTHAIESQAVESACLAIELALQKLPHPDHRHRIEHCSVCPPVLAKRIAASGISVVTQPGFVYYNGDRYLRTVPAEQQDYLYPINTLLNSGIRVAAGSDSPVAPADPLTGMYAAVTRKTIADQNLLPSEKITPLQAINLYTRQAAAALFQEKCKGSIAPGMLADLVVLNADPTRLSPQEIKDVSVEMTIVDGGVVYDNS
jgi:predicted amidohydrolase YtcJ